MFENDLADLDEDATLAAVEGNEHTAVEVEVTRLLLAAHWADLKPGDAVDPHGIPGAERAIQPGGEGTPEIADFAPAELGCSLKLSAGSAKRLIADALDLRHRLPATWAAARAGQGADLPGPPGRQTTRHLTLEQARQVDARVAPDAGRGVLGSAADPAGRAGLRRRPDGADAAAERAARERFVRLGRTTEHGLRVIWAKIDRRRRRVGRRDDHPAGRDPATRRRPDTLDVRRSKAFGMLITQPAEALRLLNSHQDDTTPTSLIGALSLSTGPTTTARGGVTVVADWAAAVRPGQGPAAGHRLRAPVRGGAQRRARAWPGSKTSGRCC